MKFEPVAIIGRGCVLPGALNPQELWSIFEAERDVVSNAPEDYWGLDLNQVMAEPGSQTKDVTWSRRGGYVRGFEDAFRPQAFAVEPSFFRGLDPLFTWACEAARQALESAGIQPGSIERTGVIAGNLSYPTRSMNEFAASVWTGQSSQPAPDPRNRFMSGYPAHVVATALGLDSSASYCLDAACASSLYAIKHACQRLQAGEVDLMLAGGINRADDLFLHVGFCALNALSKTGQSRPFHQDADGLVPAEGAGFVALKRLDDALRDGDQILGLIRGVGTSNDGRGRGLLTPLEQGQFRAMSNAYTVSGLSPVDISLVECHATGTPLGDGAELRSMARVFKGCGPVPIGSMKSNTGHLITASGAGGILKVLGAMEHGVRPASLNASALRSEVSELDFRVVRANEAWEAKGPLRAAISNFGFGGNNAHLLLESWVDDSFAPAAASLKSPEKRAEDPRTELAVVAIEVLAGSPGTRGSLKGVREFLDAGEIGRLDTIPLDLRAVRFPPNDLKQSLGQQLAVLYTMLEFDPDVYEGVDPDRVGIFMGMGCDPEIARHALRWRNERKDVVQVLESATVVGKMPNIVANRINSQFDFRGPSFSVNAEEVSGLVALDVAARALGSGELDLAFIGAVDLSDESVHRSALEAVGGQQHCADAAVVFAVMTREKALEEGREILAVLTPGRASGERESRAYGAHAADGLLELTRRVADAYENGRSANLTYGSTVGSFAASIEVTVADRGYFEHTERVRTDSTVDFPAHPEPVGPASSHAGRDRTLERAGSNGVQKMPRAPRLPAVFGALEPRRGTEGAAQPSPAVNGHASLAGHPNPGHPSPGCASLGHAAWIAEYHRTVTQVHTEHLVQQRALHERFLRALGGASPATSEPSFETREQPMNGRSNGLNLESFSHTPPHVEQAPESSGEPESTPETEGVSPSAEASEFPGLSLDKDGLRIHASGKVSEIFGPIFEVQDDYSVQCRMPEPPLLLADRLLGIDAEPGVLGTGTLWTETDVADDAWYLHDGRMPGGLMIESGQADLMLISYMGIDFLTQGERRYRLLGCELTYHESLPTVGETLRYEIHVDGHARQGPVRLFFFHYDCTVGDSLRLSVRHGQAGFFTEEELDESKGILWTPESQDLVEPPRIDSARFKKTYELDRSALEAFAAGDVVEAFGLDFERTEAHTRTPRIAADAMLFLDRARVDLEGGPWKRGYLRAEQDIEPGDWFFEGHFKNDPCMPGTLMFEGCLQTMAVYMTAMGFTVDRDGWRFEPIPEETYVMRCRGQATPESKSVVYEVFVEECFDGPTPTLFADLLCTIDGLKAFHCRRMGLRLVPDWPLETSPRLLEDHQTQVRSRRDRDARELDSRFGYEALLACAWGKPTTAFGDAYRPFDSHLTVARLPGPPYHFVSRVLEVDSEFGSMRIGTRARTEYDVPNAAWYFDTVNTGVMPYSVLLEVALQPCGWLASWVGCTLVDSARAVHFRNLDGTATLHAEVTPDVDRLRADVTLTRLSKAGGMIIVAFDVDIYTDTGAHVFEMKTVFGFFPTEALASQAGIGKPTLSVEPASADPSPSRPLSASELDRRSAEGPHLDLLDTVIDFEPDGGSAGLGRAVAEYRPNPSDWFFKAHFFQDPVQPGSIGLEAMLQLAREVALRKGLASPEDLFEPVALGVEHTWSYRGQVLPETESARFVVEITGCDAGYIEACSELWVDGTCIYRADGLALRFVEQRASVPKTGVGLARSIWPTWNAMVGAENGWYGQRLFTELLERYVGRVWGLEKLESLAGPVLFLANHQVQIESLLLTTILTGVTGRNVVALSNAKHRNRWIGELSERIWSSDDDLEDPENIVYFDRDPASFSGVREVLKQRAESGESLMVHAAGTRSASARDGTHDVSSALIDLALELNLPIVSVRISGGLPIDPVDRKLEFPWRHAPQDYWIGDILSPQELAALDHASRRARVLEALAHAGPSPAFEQPNSANESMCQEFGEVPRDVLSVLERMLDD